MVDASVRVELGAETATTLTGLTASAGIGDSSDLRHADTIANSSHPNGSSRRAAFDAVLVANRILARKLKPEAAFQTSCYTCHERSRNPGALLRTHALGTVLRRWRRRTSLGLGGGRQRCCRDGRPNAGCHQHAPSEWRRASVDPLRCSLAFQPIRAATAVARRGPPSPEDLATRL